MLVKMLKIMDGPLVLLIFKLKDLTVFILAVLSFSHNTRLTIVLGMRQSKAHNGR